MTQLCQFEEIAGHPGYQWCPVCKRPRGYPRGQTRPSPLPENLRRICETIRPATSAAEPPQRQPPSLLQRAKNYLTAREKWIAAGEPMRTDAERAALFAICEACPEYQPLPMVEGGRCKACSCGIARERDTLNKIAWATEDCPRGHWPSNKRHPDPDVGRAG